MMMVNDFPEVKPSDALETCVSFSFPCKFLKPGDARIGTGCYKAADVSLKKWCSQPEVAAQMVHIILDSYGELQLYAKASAGILFEHGGRGVEVLGAI